MSQRRSDTIQIALPLASNAPEERLDSASPLPMQYLGSKARIADWLIQHIRRRFPATLRFVDLFSGTGSVSLQAIRAGYQVLANDLQPYSAAVLQSLLLADREGLSEVAARLPNLMTPERLLAGSRSAAKDLLAREDQFLKALGTRSWEWRAYQQFCRDTPLVSGTAGETRDLRAKNGWDLFTKYYANTYFGVRQCLQLDALREYAEGTDDAVKTHIIAAAVSAMTYGVSSTTHLAQFLKPTSEIRARNLLRLRRFDLIEAVRERLIGLHSLPLPRKRARVLELDFRDALGSVQLDRSTVVYADPPYFKEHYSRYYHVLDTFCLYDYPALTHNPRLGGTTVGRYREERSVSDFGLRSSVKRAFSDLLRVAAAAGAPVALSYANTSLLSSRELSRLAVEMGYEVEREEKSLLHSGQGQPRGRHVMEYLFLLKPRD